MLKMLTGLVQPLALALLMVGSVGSVLAGSHSISEERVRWVEITRKLESDPLNENLSAQGDATIKAIENDHSIVVGLCPNVLFEFNGMKYAYSRTITRQFMLATTAFKVEHPDKADDGNRENRREQDVAALQSVLKVYRAILKQKPDATNKLLDDLLRQQNDGKLLEYVKKKCP